MATIASVFVGEESGLVDTRDALARGGVVLEERPRSCEGGDHEGAAGWGSGGNFQKGKQTNKQTNKLNQRESLPGDKDNKEREKEESITG